MYNFFKKFDFCMNKCFSFVYRTSDEIKEKNELLES